MAVKIENEMGLITLDNNVIATIAGNAAMESYGIIGMASKNATDGLFEILRSDFMTKGVKVSTDEDKMTIDLHVVLRFGVNISTVAKNIIDTVKFNVENMTGISVYKVNVLVQGIKVAK